MKRFHVHVAVRDLVESVRFYSAMFGSEPAVTKPDYAKWMLDDPRVNLAISQRGQPPGVKHRGMQAESEDELEGIHANLQHADGTIVAEKGVHCCYSKSDKYWVTDPQGIAWESFRSLGAVPLYGEQHSVAPGACCSGEGTGCCALTQTEKTTAKARGCCASSD